MKKQPINKFVADILTYTLENVFSIIPISLQLNKLFTKTVTSPVSGEY